MSQEVPTRYNRALRRRVLQPVYLVTFDGIPTRFSTGPVTNALGETKSYLTMPQGAAAQITVDEGTSSLASVNFGILDKNGEITKLLFLYKPMENRMVTIKSGFAGLDEADYALVFTGRVLDYMLESDNVVWTFQGVTLLTDEKQNIFEAFTALSTPTGSGSATLNVANTASFPSATAGVCFLRIEDEVISYTGKTGTTFTGCSRGQLGTVASSHAIDAQVTNFLQLIGNPFTLALQILTSTGLGTNGAYDVLPACAGLAIDQALVDVARFERERDRWIPTWAFTFLEGEKVDGKKFLEEQIFTFTNAYPFTTNAGKIAAKIYAPPLPTSIAEELTDDTLTAPPTFQGSVGSQYFFNEIDISYDYNFLSKEFLTRSLYEDSTSQVAYGRTTTRTLESRGIKVGIGTGQMPQLRVDNFAVRFLKRFSVPAPILQANALFSKRLLELGDVLPLTSAFIPNLDTGEIGITAKLMEIIAADPKFDSSTQDYTLLNTGYSYGRRYGAISPSTKPPVNFPNYLAATDLQRLYAFISTKTGDQSGIMSNGDPGYFITP